MGPNCKLTLFTYRRRKKAETNHNKDHLQKEETESQKLIENPKEFENNGSISSKKSLNSTKMTEGEEAQVSFKVGVDKIAECGASSCGNIEPDWKQKIYQPKMDFLSNRSVEPR